MRSRWRSLLFTPANDQARLAKAHLRGADAVILDLEDGVAPSAKTAARAGLPGVIAALAAQGVEIVVRINVDPDAAEQDLAAAVRPGVVAIMVPKADGSERLASIAAHIGKLERGPGQGTGWVGLLPLIESATGVEALTAIADTPRVVGLALGVEDFAESLGVEPSAECLDLPCRLIALAAAARGIAGIALPGGIADFRAIDVFSQAATRGRAMGLTGALCVHPDQVAAANAAFAPSPAEIAQARAVLAAWGAAGGQGVAQLDGKMIDLPVAKRAERLLAQVRP